MKQSYWVIHVHVYMYVPLTKSMELITLSRRGVGGGELGEGSLRGGGGGMFWHHGIQTFIFPLYKRVPPTCNIGKINNPFLYEFTFLHE